MKTLNDKYKFVLDLWGYKVSVSFEPYWLGTAMHLEFKSEPYEAGSGNPLSETGYFSHFITGTPEDEGITEANMISQVQKLAIKIATERNNQIYQDAAAGQSRLL